MSRLGALAERKRLEHSVRSSAIRTTHSTSKLGAETLPSPSAWKVGSRTTSCSFEIVKRWRDSGAIGVASGSARRTPLSFSHAPLGMCGFATSAGPYPCDRNSSHARSVGEREAPAFAQLPEGAGGITPLCRKGTSRRLRVSAPFTAVDRRHRSKLNPNPTRTER
jgi:hypothetical protein